MGAPATSLVDQWADPRWRLSNLYWIEDKDGRLVPFHPNWAQLQLLDEFWYLNVLLKARQLGFSTFISLFHLDACLFNGHTSAGLVADTLDNAKEILRSKVSVPYMNLPEGLRDRIRLITDAKTEMMWSNGSTYRVGTSLRSGTYQYLHISEHGKICARTPDKAKEIRTGALNTVQAGNFITIESTAEGQSGDYKDICDRAERLAHQGRQLTKLDFKFHFYAWWQEPGYVLTDADAANVIITTELADYFEKVEAEIGRAISTEQRAWYAKKFETQQDDMKREYPSTAKEAFEAAIEGAYFARQMAKVRREGRICRLPVLDRPIDTYWDLGVGDAMTITFIQWVGLEPRIVDYYENSGEGFGHYWKVLRERGYTYGKHHLPHDAGQRQKTVEAKTSEAYANDAGIKPTVIVPRIATYDVGIEASRDFLASVYIDEVRCARLIECLDNYRKEWNDLLGVWRDTPRHDEFSHGYKSFETAAVAKRDTGTTTDWSKPIGSKFTGAARA